MRCKCILTKSKTMPGECDHKIGHCKMRAKKLLRSPGVKRPLCFGCSRQYEERWKLKPLRRLTDEDIVKTNRRSK